MVTGMNRSQVRLSKTDKAILHSFEPALDCIAEAFGSSCEVVLHSLEHIDHSIIKIVNGHVTGRKVGSPLTTFGMELLQKADSLDKDVIDSHWGRQYAGKLLKSVTLIIRNGAGKAIGFLCINIDVTMPLFEFMTGFLPVDRQDNIFIKSFPSNVKELVDKTLESVITMVSAEREISASEKNKLAVTELYKRGMFKIAGAVDVVAKTMGISRYTVYNYIRAAKADLNLLDTYQEE